MSAATHALEKPTQAHGHSKQEAHHGCRVGSVSLGSPAPSSRPLQRHCERQTQPPKARHYFNHHPPLICPSSLCKIEHETRPMSRDSRRRSRGACDNLMRVLAECGCVGAGDVDAHWTGRKLIGAKTFWQEFSCFRLAIRQLELRTISPHKHTLMMLLYTRTH